MSDDVQPTQKVPSTYDKLARQFPTEEHKTLAARGGQTYVPWNLVVERLNEELTVTGWSFSVIREGFTEAECWVLGRLTATIDGKETFREQYGCADLKLGQSFNTDLLKKAGTDSLKKCAQVLGVALYLTDADDRAEVQAAMVAEKQAAAKAEAEQRKAEAAEQLAARAKLAPTPIDSKTHDSAVLTGATPNQQQRWSRLVAEAERIKLPTLGQVKAIDPKAVSAAQLKSYGDLLETRIYEAKEAAGAA